MVEKWERTKLKWVVNGAVRHKNPSIRQSEILPDWAAELKPTFDLRAGKRCCCCCRNTSAACNVLKSWSRYFCFASKTKSTLLYYIKTKSSICIYLNDTDEWTFMGTTIRHLLQSSCHSNNDNCLKWRFERRHSRIRSKTTTSLSACYTDMSPSWAHAKMGFEKEFLEFV